jgi:hypothetical protein
VAEGKDLVSIPKKEIALNAVNWFKEYKDMQERGLISKRLGVILMYFDLGDPEGSAVCVGSIHKTAVADMCECIIKKVRGDKSRILDPYGRN